MGCRREDLTYIVQLLECPENPAIHVASVIPNSLNETSPRIDIPKVLVYLPLQAACQIAVNTLRKCLPKSLRYAVRQYSASIDEEDKVGV